MLNNCCISLSFIAHVSCIFAVVVDNLNIIYYDRCFIFVSWFNRLQFTLNSSNKQYKVSHIEFYLHEQRNAFKYKRIRIPYSFQMIMVQSKAKGKEPFRAKMPFPPFRVIIIFIVIITRLAPGCTTVSVRCNKTIVETHTKIQHSIDDPVELDLWWQDCACDPACMHVSFIAFSIHFFRNSLNISNTVDSHYHYFC